ncbi:hypothetical protein HK405_003676 [Cladochytrium tenue]|nr:hypothetical protein HK405_003676 [Cladochytrium tenue]
MRETPAGGEEKLFGEEAEKLTGTPRRSSLPNIPRRSVGAGVLAGLLVAAVFGSAAVLLIGEIGLMEVIPHRKAEAAGVNDGAGAASWRSKSGESTGATTLLEIAVPAELARGRFKSVASVHGYRVGAEGADATMQAFMAFCTGGVPDRGSNPVMLTRHVAVWDSDAVNTTALYLDTCFPIEISTSQELRTEGHCSDFAQYVFYAGARLAGNYSREVMEEKVLRCPGSTFLHGEYPIEQLFLGTERAPAAARNFWMPNVEQVTMQQARLFEHTHTFLAKTKVTARAVSDYLRTRGITRPRNWLMYHSSPDPMTALAGAAYTKDYAGGYLHAYGRSGRKHTRQLLDCWLQHPEWPALDVVGSSTLGMLLREHRVTLRLLAEQDPTRFNESTFPENLRVHTGLGRSEFLALVAARGVHLCPSQQEGYGHYINVARALGAYIVTTDYPPMNELVEDGETGQLVRAARGAAAAVPEAYQLMQGVFVSPYNLTPEDVCGAVERAFAVPEQEREAIGRRARQAYEKDMGRMLENMGRLIVEASQAVSGEVAEDAVGSSPIRSSLPSTADYEANLRRAWTVVLDLESALLRAVTFPIAKDIMQ